MPENGTSTEAYPDLDGTSIARSAVLLAIFALSLVGNLRALRLLLGNRCRGGANRSSSLLVLHLILADLLVTGFCLLGNSAWMLSVQFHGGDLLCRLFKFGQSFALNSSTYVTLAIAIYRAGAILRPWRWNRDRTLAGLLVAAWAASAVVSAPQTLYFGLARGPWQEDFYQCVAMEMRPLGSLADYADRITLLYMLFNMLSQFFIPVCCMSASYAFIVNRIAGHSRKLTLTRQSSQLSSGGSLRLRQLQLRQQRRRQPFLARARATSSRMFSAMVLAFALLWLPYWALYAAACANRLSGGRHTTAIDAMSRCVFFFGMSVSAVNPLIYGAYSGGGCRRKSPRPDGGGGGGNAEAAAVVAGTPL